MSGPISAVSTTKVCLGGESDNYLNYLMSPSNKSAVAGLFDLRDIFIRRRPHFYST